MRSGVDANQCRAAGNPAIVWLYYTLPPAVFRGLAAGKLAGDFSDLLGMVFLGIPVLLVTVGLTLRAAYLGIREFLGHHAPIVRPLP